MNYTVIGNTHVKAEDEPRLIRLAQLLSSRGDNYYYTSRRSKPGSIFYENILSNLRQEMIVRSWDDRGIMITEIMNLPPYIRRSWERTDSDTTFSDNCTYRGERHFRKHWDWKKDLANLHSIIVDNNGELKVDMVLCYTLDGGMTPKMIKERDLCGAYNIPFLNLGDPFIYSELSNGSLLDRIEAQCCSR